MTITFNNSKEFFLNTAYSVNKILGVLPVNEIKSVLLYCFSVCGFYQHICVCVSV